MPWELKNHAKPLGRCLKSRLEQIRSEVVSGTLWDRFFQDFGTIFGSLEGPWDVLKTSGLDIDFQENLEMAGESS